MGFAMSALPKFRWSLLIYRVSSEAQQQRILTSFHRSASPGMTVLGTRAGQERFVIVDCDTLAHDLRARRVIAGIDTGATKILRTKASA